MIHTHKSIPYKPREWVYFLMDNAIMAGQVEEIHIKLEGDTEDIKETTEWIIKANGSSFHCSLDDIASMPDTILNRAKSKYEDFANCCNYSEKKDPYSHVKEVF